MLGLTQTQTIAAYFTDFPFANFICQALHVFIPPWYFNNVDLKLAYIFLSCVYYVPKFALRK